MSNFQLYTGSGPRIYPTYSNLRVSDGDIVDFGTVPVPNDGRWSSSAGPATVTLSPFINVPVVPQLAVTSQVYNPGTGAPTTGSYTAGETAVDSTGAEFICTVSGTPGTWVSAQSATYVPLLSTAAWTSGNLAAGKVNTVDASSAGQAPALPTPTVVGQILGVEKTDASVNTVVISGTIRGSSTSVTLYDQFESVLFEAESLSSWRPLAGHKTKTSLDNRYASAASFAATDAFQARALAQLNTFIDWLGIKPGSRGFIGETGWPRADGSDGTAWNQAAELWYRTADKAKLWVTQWASGVMFGPNYNMSAYSNPDGSSAVSLRRAGTADIVEAHKTFGRTLRGVNVSSLDWTIGVNDGAGTTSSTFSNAAPGTVGTDFKVEPSGTWAYLFSQGVRLVRIGFRWERIQPTLGAALDTTYLGYLQGEVTAARAAGLYVVIDCHNYGGYWTTGPTRNPLTITNYSYVTSGVTSANFMDLWSRLSTVFKSDAGVFYGLMNEPVSLGASADYWNPTTVVSDFEDGTIQSWTIQSGTGFTLSNSTTSPKVGTKCLAVASTGASNFVSLQRSPFTTYGGTNKYGVWVKAPNAAGASLGVTPGSDFASWAGPTVPLIANVWTFVGCTPPPERVGDQVGAFNLVISGLPTGSASTIYVDQLGVGFGTLLPPTGAGTWERIAQQVVSNLRANGDNKLVMVPLYQYSFVGGALSNHPNGPWINDPANNFMYEGHHYWSTNTNDNYSTFAAELAAAQAAGYGPSY